VRGHQNLWKPSAAHLWKADSSYAETTQPSICPGPNEPTGRRRSVECAQHRLRVPADDRQVPVIGANVAVQFGGRALYARIMAHAAANGRQVTKDYRNFYGLRLAEQPRVEPNEQRVVDSWMDSR
jgi:hypothetical protein